MKSSSKIISLLIERALKSLWETSDPSSKDLDAEPVPRGTLQTPGLQEVARKLETYVTKVWEWNQKFNLTGAKAPQVFCRDHILDCLAALAELEKQNRLRSLVSSDVEDSGTTLPRDKTPQAYTFIDVGTGAGLPGLVWACARQPRYPQQSILLVESLQKRAAFLQHMCAQLDLPQVEVLGERFEALSEAKLPKLSSKLSQNLTEAPVIVSRGTTSPKKLCEWIAAPPVAFRAWYVFSTERSHKEFLTLQKSFAKAFEVRSLSYPHVAATSWYLDLLKDASRKGLEEEAIKNLMEEEGQEAPKMGLLTEILPLPRS